MAPAVIANTTTAVITAGSERFQSGRDWIAGATAAAALLRKARGGGFERRRDLRGRQQLELAGGDVVAAQ